MNKKGFTMIELLVAMSLFIIVIAIASGAFIRSMRTQRATVALIAANNNASLAIEQMMREIRTGTNFTIIGGPSGEGDEITFFSARESRNVSYRWNQNDKSIERVDPDAFTPAFLKVITAKNVIVENLKFNLLEGPPSRITIVLQVGAVGAPSEVPFINLQTTVSSRAF